MNKKKGDKRKGIAYLGGAGLVGQQTIRSGIPRLLGVRLESHSTSKKSAEEILNKGGILDPNRGGTGASKAVNDKDYISQSKNYVHITGKHKDHKIEAERVIRKNSAGEVLSSTPKYRYETNRPIRDVLYRKQQRGLYRGISGESLNIKDLKGVSKTASSVLGGVVGLKGKTLYVGGSDRYFNKNFIPDNDDIGLKSAKKLKVYGNRASATLAAIKKEGGGDSLKGVTKLIKANPKRVLAGATILAVGSLATKKLGELSYKNLVDDGKVKSYTRKNRSGKWSNVKSFIRRKLRNK